MSVEEKKAAEANGTEILREVRSETNSDSTSEELPPYRKRNRRTECIYISIAVVLGASLIAVLIYFSVTNALKSEDPEPVDKGASMGGTTTPYMTTDGTTADFGPGDISGLSRDATGGGNPILRGLFPPGPAIQPSEETTGATTTTTTTDAGPDMSDKGSLLRGARGGPPSGPSFRGALPPADSTK